MSVLRSPSKFMALMVKIVESSATRSISGVLCLLMDSCVFFVMSL